MYKEETALFRKIKHRWKVLMIVDVTNIKLLQLDLLHSYIFIFKYRVLWNTELFYYFVFTSLL